MIEKMTTSTTDSLVAVAAGVAVMTVGVAAEAATVQPLGISSANWTMYGGKRIVPARRSLRLRRTWRLTRTF